MAVLSKGNDFNTGDQVTADALDELVDNAQFAGGAVDNVTTQLSSGAIIVRDGGISGAKIADEAITLEKLATSLRNAMWPVGSIYYNAEVSTNPATLMGFGTWQSFGQGRVLVGLDLGDADFDTLEETGGAKTHTLTESEIPAHTHGYGNTQRVQVGFDNGVAFDAETGTAFQSGSTGGGQAHNNLQPYIVAYRWKRTA